MKLTKLQRHTAYIILLVELEGWSGGRGFCLAWYDLFSEKTWGVHFGLDKILPELWNKRTNEPEGSCESWFHSREQRLKALKQCIQETY